MPARMINPAFVLPDALEGLEAFSKAVANGGISVELRELVGLRASQINGCSSCVHAHSANLVEAGAHADRVVVVAAWRDAPFFDPGERAALELAETLTRSPDCSADVVSDDLWDRLTEYYDETQVAALLLQIALTNMVNRLSTAIKEPVMWTWD